MSIGCVIATAVADARKAAEPATRKDWPARPWEVVVGDAVEGEGGWSLSLMAVGRARET